MIWTPHVTVATVIAKEDRFLLVHENTDVGQVYNQPAGHLDPDETLIQAAERETREETGWHVRIDRLLAVNLYNAPNGLTYLRTSFSATPLTQIADATLDKEIIEAVWLTYDDIVQRKAQLRSPLVLSDIERFRSGKSFPLEILTNFNIDSRAL
jgi:ADP-ribose pyrophosphatase YjhB (NUDIX family)